MAHLFSGMINTNNNWEKLSKFTQFNLVSGETYKIQILNSANLRKGTIGEGFYYSNTQPFDFVAGDEDIYIKTSWISCLFSIEGGSTTPAPEEKVAEVDLTGVTSLFRGEDE